VTAAARAPGAIVRKAKSFVIAQRAQVATPAIFAVLDLLVLLDQAKSTRKESVRRKLFERSFAMRKLLCASRNDDYLLVSCF